MNQLREGLKRHFRPEQLERLRKARVGVAGAGGLGSNAAMMLARSGVGALYLVDHDRVEPSNLNRQQFWPRHVGRYKVEALAESLAELDPELELCACVERLEPGNMRHIAANAPIWVEALDDAAVKSDFVENALLAGCRVAAASGLCGYGGRPMLRRRIGNLVVAGDFSTGAEQAPPLAPRVTQAAALLADACLEFILDG